MRLKLEQERKKAEDIATGIAGLVVEELQEKSAEIGGSYDVIFTKLQSNSGSAEEVVEMTAYLQSCAEEMANLQQGIETDLEARAKELASSRTERDALAAECEAGKTALSRLRAKRAASGACVIRKKGQKKKPPTSPKASEGRLTAAPRSAVIRRLFRLLRAYSNRLHSSDERCEFRFLHLVCCCCAHAQCLCLLHEVGLADLRLGGLDCGHWSRCNWCNWCSECGLSITSVLCSWCINCTLTDKGKSAVLESTLVGTLTPILAYGHL